MSTRPLPDFAREQLILAANAIRALRPGARDVTYLDIGSVRMTVFGLNQMWQQTPWVLLNFTYSRRECTWTDAPQDTKSDASHLAPAREYMVYKDYIGFTLITPEGRLEFADTIQKFTELYRQYYR